MSKRSIIDDSYMITDRNSVVSLVCKKGTEHGFLLIEHHQAGAIHYYRSDLFIDKDQPTQTVEQHSLFSPVRSSLPAGAQDIIVNGKAVIELKEKTEEEFRELRDSLTYYSWPVSNSKATNLLNAITQDKTRNIAYALGGDGSSWSSVVSQCGNYHSCISWAKEKLKDIGLETGWRWTDIAMQVPSEAVLGASSQSGSCLIL